MNSLVTASELADLIAREAVVVIDVQYNLVGTPGAQLYADAHLPNAPHLDLDAALAGPPGRQGRHPLPPPDDLQGALRECGVDDDDDIVVYDQKTSLAAARAWWILRWAGHPAVRVLDGGLEAWRAAGYPVTDEVPDPEPGTIVVQPGSVPVLTADSAAEMARVGTLLDARAPERFRGEQEPIDKVAGHIPGAVNLPMTELLTPTGSFADVATIRARASEVGVGRGTPVGTSCGSGVTAAQLSLALAQAGIESIPYIGSWSEWIADPSRPVATGDAAR